MVARVHMVAGRLGRQAVSTLRSSSQQLHLACSDYGPASTEVDVEVAADVDVEVVVIVSVEVSVPEQV
jgi:hypothetical protein